MEPFSHSKLKLHLMPRWVTFTGCVFETCRFVFSLHDTCKSIYTFNMLFYRMYQWGQEWLPRPGTWEFLFEYTSPDPVRRIYWKWIIIYMRLVFNKDPHFGFKMRATFITSSQPIMHYFTWLPVTRCVCSAWCPHVHLGSPSSSQQTCGSPWWHEEPSSWIHWGRESKDPDSWKGAGRGSCDPSPNGGNTVDQWTVTSPCPDLRQPMDSRPALSRFEAAICYWLLQSVVSTTVQVHPPGGLDGWRGLGGSDRAWIQQGAAITRPG